MVYRMRRRRVRGESQRMDWRSTEMAVRWGTPPQAVWLGTPPFCIRRAASEVDARWTRGDPVRLCPRKITKMIFSGFVTCNCKYVVVHNFIARRSRWTLHRRRRDARYVCNIHRELGSDTMPQQLTQSCSLAPAGWEAEFSTRSRTRSAAWSASQSMMIVDPRVARACAQTATVSSSLSST